MWTSGRRDSPVIEIMDQVSRDYTTDDGKKSCEHPDVEAVNDVSGTVATTWRLVRR